MIYDAINYEVPLRIFYFLKRTYFWLILDLPEVYFGLTFTFFHDFRSLSPHSL